MVSASFPLISQAASSIVSCWSLTVAWYQYCGVGHIVEGERVGAVEDDTGLGEEVAEGVDLKGSDAVGGVGGVDNGGPSFDVRVEDGCVTLLGVTSSGRLATFVCFFFFSAMNTSNISMPSSLLSELEMSDSWSATSMM